MTPYKRLSDELPAEGVEVMTKTEDASGDYAIHNGTRFYGMLFAASNVAGYYIPTHWRPLEDGE